MTSERHPQGEQIDYDEHAEALRAHEVLYVLAAVIVAEADAERHREALRALLYRGQLQCTGGLKAAGAAASACGQDSDYRRQRPQLLGGDRGHA